MPMRRRAWGWPGSRRIARWLKAWRQDLRGRLAARAEARAHGPVLPGERLLAVARCAGGELAAATDRALYHETDWSWARLGWEQVGHARWDEQRQVLTLTGLAPPARTVLRLASDWGLPAVADERVTWTRVVDQRV